MNRGIMTLKRPLLLAATLAVLLLSSACQHSAHEGDHHLTIEGHRWDVELATTDNERFTGMGGRNEAPAGTGMLFIFPDDAHRQFVMRACLIPLDIAFINGEGRIVAIHTMKVEPDQRHLPLYRSGRPARFALEVAAGEFQRLGIKVGQQVIFSKDTQRVITDIERRGY